MPRRRRRMKLVELPVSASEDRVVGTLSLEEAVRHGERRFQPGLLAEANRGILYIDEVNLLDDHLVDVLLDAAASGVNHVEREGISYTHPARFILVGTMNPEEGELRPQLMDRFGLVVDVEGIADPAQRAEIVRRRLAFEDDPAGFAAAWRAEEERLGRAIAAARALLPRVEVPDDLLHLIATVALAMGVDGHRADIVMYKAARANAALGGRRRATDGDVLEAAALVLPHRMRRRPFEDASFDRSRVEEIIARFEMWIREGAAFDGEEHDVFGVEVCRVLGEGGPARMLDALVNGQNGNVAGPGQPAVVEDCLQVAQDLRRPVGLSPNAGHKVRAGQVERGGRNAFAAVLKQVLRFVPKNVGDVGKGEFAGRAFCENHTLSPWVNVAESRHGDDTAPASASRLKAPRHHAVPRFLYLRFGFAALR